MNQILRRQTSRSHYGSKVPAVTVTVFKYLNSLFLHQIVFRLNLLFLHQILFRLNSLLRHQILFKLNLLFLHQILFRLNSLFLHQILFRLSLLFLHQILFKLNLLCTLNLISTFLFKWELMGITFIIVLHVIIHYIYSNFIKVLTNLHFYLMI